MKINPGNDEILRKELLALGARPYELVALGMEPVRGLAALHFAQAKGVERPIAYAIVLFDDPDWNPSGESKRKGTNRHVGESKPLPPPMRERNLAEAKKILAMLKGEK